MNCRAFEPGRAAEMLLQCAAECKPLPAVCSVRPDELPFAVLAVRFERMPASFRFRALFEEWTIERIVKEIF